MNAATAPKTCEFSQTLIFFFSMHAGTVCRGVGGGGRGGRCQQIRIRLDMATAAVWERFQQTLDRDVSRARFTASDEHLLGII